MGLKQRKETYTVIDVQDLESFVEKTYKWEDVNFPYQDEWTNDCMKYFDVEDQLDEHDAKLIAKFESGENPSFVCGAVLNKLCTDGHIKKGLYLIDVCW